MAQSPLSMQEMLTCSEIGSIFAAVNDLLDRSACWSTRVTSQGGRHAEQWRCIAVAEGFWIDESLQIGKVCIPGTARTSRLPMIVSFMSGLMMRCSSWVVLTARHRDRPSDNINING